MRLGAMPSEPDPASPSERSSIDDILDVYKRDVDRGLLERALRMTPEERLLEVERLNAFAEALRAAGKRTFG